MNILPSFDQALRSLNDILVGLNLKFCIIGGIASQVHAEPRFTRDIDLTVLADIATLESLIDRILAALPARFPDAREIALQAQILPVIHMGVEVDIALGLTGYEGEVLKRSSLIDLLPDLKIPICSKEDLAIMKSLAGRERDIMDLRALIQKNGSSIDVDYIYRTLNEFKLALDDSSALILFDKIFKQEHGE